MRISDPLAPGGTTGQTPSDDAAALSALVAGVYDAAVDPTIWTRVLQAATVFVGEHELALAMTRHVLERCALEARATG